MFMTVTTQLVCLIMAMACVGQALRAEATRFDKIIFPLASLGFVIITLYMGYAQVFR